MSADLTEALELVTGTVAVLLDLDEADLAPDQELTGLEGWDSVNALRILVYLERETGSPLDFERFAGAETISDVAEQIAETVGGKVATP